MMAEASFPALDLTDPEFGQAIELFMNNRAASSVCWVLALDEITAGCLAESVTDSGRISTGLICSWPVDLTGETVVEQDERETTQIVAIDLSTDEKCTSFINAARQVVTPGDALVICGVCPDAFMKRRSEFLERCEAWGIYTIWGGPEEAVPDANSVDLLIKEIRVAYTGCASIRTVDFLYDLAKRIESADLTEIAPRDREGWCDTRLQHLDRVRGEIQSAPGADGTAVVRTCCGKGEINVSALPPLQKGDLIWIDHKKRIALEKIDL